MKNRALLTLFFTIFLDMVGVGILIPVLPVLFADPTSPQYLLSPGTSLKTGYVYLGIMLALYSFGQFIAAPIIGQLSDRYGRKKLLIISIIGTVVGQAFFALAIYFKIVALLFIVRFFVGITTGNLVIAQASIADLTVPDNRAKNFGLIGAAFGLGFVVGPFIGGKLADPTLVSWFNAATPFMFASLLSLLNLIFVMYLFKETNQQIMPTGGIRWAKSLHNIGHAFNSKKLRPIFLTSFLFQMGFSFYTTFGSVFLFYRFGFSESTIGNYFAYVGLWVVFSQAVVTRLVSARYTEGSIVQNSLILVGLTMLMIFLSPHSTWLYFIVPLFAMAIGLTQANITSLLSRSVGPTMQGEILGMNGSVNALAMTIPPLIAGVVAGTFDPSTPILISSIIIIISGIYFNNYIRCNKQLIAVQ